MRKPDGGTFVFFDVTDNRQEGEDTLGLLGRCLDAGVLLTPGESARFETSGSDLELLHMVTPKPPAAVEDGLRGGPGYFFNRQTLRALSDASGGRVRRFCAESSVML
ncbi:MAG: hypothetical protein IIC53_12210, partial [Proteobacteria bacterium]|nr:hypothetical protein [Pseudomonadota bacterium]